MSGRHQDLAAALKLGREHAVDVLAQAVARVVQGLGAHRMAEHHAEDDCAATEDGGAEQDERAEEPDRT